MNVCDVLHNTPGIFQKIHQLMYWVVRKVRADFEGKLKRRRFKFLISFIKFKSFAARTFRTTQYYRCNACNEMAYRYFKHLILYKTHSNKHSLLIKLRDLILNNRKEHFR